MTALATRPDDLRLAAQTLVRGRAELEEVAARLTRAAQESTSGWQGVAALGQRTATARMHAAVVARCAPVSEVSSALADLADQAAHAQSVVRAAQRDAQEAGAERSRLIRSLSTVTDPVELEVLRQRITVLEVMIRRSGDEIAWAENQLERGRQWVDRVLRDSWLGVGVDDLADLVQAGEGLAPLWRGGGLVVVGGRVLLSSVRLARAFDPFARAVIEARLDRLLKVVMKRPVLALLTMAPARVIVPVVVISGAIPDVIDGGGYEGWQGFTLRVTAALAIPGAVAMVMPHPVVAGIGAVTVGGYYLAKGGFALHDHRILLAQVGAQIYRRRHEIVKIATTVLRPSPAFPLGPLGPMAPLVPRPRDLLDELPRLEELRSLLPGIGGPIGVPRVPIELGPRLPAIPLPSLGVVGAGLLLPRLGRLF
ncbi:hypothetical protein FNH13_12945 [Ornithinimicrobium ciconiae]|uniref:Uncharacterized protein n=1 Tax=Ornithinimicrobium ciconiae TaxID=2594265 RepID=A0A516GC64_9MICO|nr:hypothetical protein [Ornithinimicrobium ciconiae]QDO89121.1 hypothetical protein FNH13_12945 [Ornithinimicrobium ciconiae]